LPIGIYSTWLRPFLDASLPKKRKDAPSLVTAAKIMLTPRAAQRIDVQLF